MQALRQRAPGLVTVAVTEAGRRARDAAVCDPALLAACGRHLVVLDDAGPRSAAWSAERPRGAAASAEPLTGRTPHALDDAEWDEVTEAFKRAARACERAGIQWALGLDDDGLLHDALRHAPERALDVARACAPPCVVLPVEDLAPGGLDATDGVTFARALVAGGTHRIIASAGARALLPLRARRKGDTAGTTAALVAAASSAAWLVGRVDARVEAIVPHLALDGAAEVGGVAELAAERVDGVARALGLARIWIEDAAHLEDGA